MEGPIYYDYATALNNMVTPATLKPHDNLTTQYYVRYLLKRAMSVIKFDNIPDNWDIDYIRYALFGRGYCVVINSSAVGVIPQICTLGGYGVYRTPTFAMVANPALPVTESGKYWLASEYDRNKHADVRGTAVLLKLQPDFRGVLDVCTITAERLAWMHEALVMNLANSKLAYIFAAEGKAAAETFKTAMDEIQNGNLAVAAGKGLWDHATGKPLWSGFNTNVRQNYIASDLLENMRAELNDFNNFMGIPSTNYNKKAHMTETEVNANDVETESIIDVMMDTLGKCVREMNDRYGLNVQISKRYGDANRGDTDG